MIGQTIGEIAALIGKGWRLLMLLVLVPSAAGGMYGFGTFSNSDIVTQPRSSTSFSGLTTKAPPDRSDIRNQLADLAAERYEAGGMLRRLHFVGVFMDPRDDRMVNPADRALREATLTLNLPADTAVVMIAAEPIAWTVKHGGARERARIGFEGAAPFAISAPPGVMSGFRIGALGAYRISYPIDPIRETDRNISRLCMALAIWGRHFDVDMVQMSYTLVTNPTNLVLSDIVNPVGGRVVSSYSGSSLRTFCYGEQRTSSRHRPKRFYNPVTQRYE